MRTTIDRLRRLECTFVMGNHDRFLLSPGAVGEYSRTEFVARSVEQAGASLADDDRLFLRTFRRQVLLDCDGVSVLFIHGTPDSDTGLILPAMSDEQIRTALGPVEAPVVVCGHSHVQFMGQAGEKVIINPDSVGMAFRDAPTEDAAPTLLPVAQYATLDCRNAGLSVTFRRLKVNGRPG